MLQPKKREERGNLESFPGLSNGERSLLFENVEDGASNSLSLLRLLTLELNGFHLWLWFLGCHQPNCCPKHHFRADYEAFEAFCEFFINYFMEERRMGNSEF